MSRRVLVVGGCGFIGSHLVDRLVQDGDEVVVVDDLSTGTLKHLNDGARFYYGGVSDRAFLGRIFEQHEFDCVINQAAKINTNVMHEEPAVDVQVSVLGVVNLAELCLQHEVKRLVHASSVAVYGRQTELPVSEARPPAPIYSYGVAKQCAEQYLDFYASTHGLLYTCLRYANVYGPRQPIYGEVGVIAIFTDRVVSGRELTIFGDGNHVRDYVYVADAVEATVAAMEAEGDHVLNIGLGRPTTVNELYECFANATPGAIACTQAPERVGELGSFFTDVSRARKVLGWEPQTSVAQGVRLTMDYHLNRD